MMRPSGVGGGGLQRRAEGAAERCGCRRRRFHGVPSVHDDGRVPGACTLWTAGSCVVRVQRGAPTHHQHMCPIPFGAEFHRTALGRRPAASQRDQASELPKTVILCLLELIWVHGSYALPWRHSLPSHTLSARRTHTNASRKDAIGLEEPVPPSKLIGVSVLGGPCLFLTNCVSDNEGCCSFRLDCRCHCSGQWLGPDSSHGWLWIRGAHVVGMDAVGAVPLQRGLQEVPEGLYFGESVH